MAANKNNQKNPKIEPLSVYLIITHKNNKPVLEIRKQTNDPKMIKQILSSAFHDKPIVVFPTFRDRIRAIASLCKEGILGLDKEKNKYFYKI